MPSLTPKETTAKKEVEKIKPTPNVSPTAAGTGIGQKVTDINTDVSQLAARPTLTRDDVKALLDKWKLLTYEGLYVVETSFNKDPAKTDVIKNTYIDAVKALIQKYKQTPGVTEEGMLLDFNFTLIWWARQVLQKKRRKIVFIVGDTVNDDFYKYAKKFFTHLQTTEPDLEIREQETTLRAIRDHLHANSDITTLPFGEVNIVTHANAYGATNMKVEDADDYGASIETLNTFTDHLNYKALDSASKVFIRGCSVGNSADFMQAFADAIGKDDQADDELPHAYAPKYLQMYGATVEFFREFWYVGYPSDKTLNKEQLVAKFKARYPTETVDWGKLYDIKVKHESYKYEEGYDGFFLYPAIAQNLTFAQEILRSKGANTDGIVVLERKEKKLADGTIEIQLNIRQADGTKWIGTNVLPSLKTQEEMRDFASKQPDLAAEIRTLENHSNLTPLDFFWENLPGNIAGYVLRKNTTLAYSRKLSRLERDLTDPRGSTNAAHRIKPDEENINHYAHVSPPLHFHKPPP